jgi:hypothetical protein
MVELTMQLPDQLAARVQPLRHWLPTVLELILVGFKTPATQTASEVIEFLATEPTPHSVLAYHVSARAQQRQERLLTLNAAGMLNQDEQRELNELEQIEHIVVMLKAQAVERIQQVN